MGKVVEKKKKKGRPSLLDLQKRTLKEQEEQRLKQQEHELLQKKRNHSITKSKGTSLRRSTRRNPNFDGEKDSEEDPDDDSEDEEDDELEGKRREKKLKLVLKLPKNSNSCGEDSNVEDENGVLNHKKRKINAIGDGSGLGGALKAEQSILGANTVQGSQLDSEPSTPLPDKKLLVFILDRLQKKDTYSVFSEPVDPSELPDYHEVIECPMDFGTVRKKLASGAYANLEQFENDVFLIGSNGMQYNAPDTIYFRQARSIRELAEKSFDNLRQDSDDNEQEPKIVRRGRPPTKNLKKPLGRPPLERAVSSDATLATRGENSISPNYDLRRGTILSENPGPAQGSRNNDRYTGWLADNFDRNDDSTGSMLKGSTIKKGKKPFVLEENRRNSYKQFYPATGGRESSVLNTFDGEGKQLMAVGLLAEHGYARSLTRFAANLGPVAWGIASKNIERCLPAGLKFGPGWVGENDVIPQRQLVPHSLSPERLSQSQPILSGNSFSVAARPSSEPKADKISDTVQLENSSERHLATQPTLDASLTVPRPPSTGSCSYPFVANKSMDPNIGKAESSTGLNSRSGFNMPNSSVDAGTPIPLTPIQRSSPVVQPGTNGVNSAYGFNVPSQMAKFQSAARPVGFNLQSLQMLDPLSRRNTNFISPATRDISTSQDPQFPDNANTIKSASSLQNSIPELEATRPGHQTRPSWQGLSQQQKPDSEFSQQQKPDLVPPDLNIRFRPSGSPSSSRVDSAQPDLALQL